MPKPFRPFAVASLALAACLACQTASAQSAEAARAAVRQALQHQPEVLAKLNAYLAKTEAVDIARARWKPRVDLNASVGTDRYRNDGTGSTSVNHGSADLVVSQVLWDGMGTARAVDQAGHERLNRWFDFVGSSEQVAYEAVRALYDVQRQRKLVALAEDNLAQHRMAAEKIDQRVKAGVGRGVDLDQASARLALAESNLATEQANLHDVAARYLRIIGQTPSSEVGELEVLRSALPATESEAVQTALAGSPLIAAAIENLRAARASASGQKSSFQPKVEARARVGAGRNYNSVVDRQGEGAVELVMNWNLFNGGADQAAQREQQRLVAQAQDLRDKACRDVRQNAAVAFNDTQKLKLQLGVLARNATAIERARDAYRQQFDIGQRSLLDLLNSENEAYTARRALTNAVFDRAVAHANTLAAMNQLTTRLEIARNNAPEGSGAWAAGADAPVRCPVEALPMAAVPTQGDAAGAVMAGTAVAPAMPAETAASPARYTHAVMRAADTVAPAAAPAAAVATAPKAAGAWAHPAGSNPIAVRPVADTAGARTAPPGVGPSGDWGSDPRTDAGRRPGQAQSADPAAAAVTPLLSAWARAWDQKDLQRYTSLYVQGFAGEEDSATQWQARNRYLFGRKLPVRRTVDGVVARVTGPGEVETRFVQVDSDGKGQVQSERVMVWREVAGRWRIASERTL